MNVINKSIQYAFAKKRKLFDTILHLKKIILGQLPSGH